MCLTSFLFLRVSVDHSPDVRLWTGSSLQKYNQVLFQEKVVRGREGVKSPCTYTRSHTPQLAKPRTSRMWTAGAERSFHLVLPPHRLRDPEAPPGRPVCSLCSMDLRASTSLEDRSCSHIHLPPGLIHTPPLVGIPPAASSSPPALPLSWYLRAGALFPSLGVHVSAPQQDLELPHQDEELLQFPSSLAETQ